MKLKLKGIIAIGISLAVLVIIVVIGFFLKDEIRLLIDLKNGNIAEDVIGDIIEQPEPEIDVEYINEKLANVSTLQTAKITYGCMVDFKEGTVPIITQSAFSMYYEATAYAAIEVSEIVCEEKDGKFIIKLPEATIQEPNINPDSLEFYDIKNGFLNKTELGDVAEALQYAKKDFYYQQTTYQLLDMANKNAVTVLENFLSCFIDAEKFEIIETNQNKEILLNSPIASSDKITMNYSDLKTAFENAGFTNITLNPINDVKVGLFAKEGDVESISIDGKTEFRKNTVFKAESEVIITYHVKEEK